MPYTELPVGKDFALIVAARSRLLNLSELALRTTFDLNGDLLIYVKNEFAPSAHTNKMRCVDFQKSRERKMIRLCII